LSQSSININIINELGIELSGSINNIRSMYIGNNNFMLLISVDVEDFSRGHAIETATEQIRADISGKYPHAKYIYIDVRPGNC